MKIHSHTLIRESIVVSGYDTGTGKQIMEREGTHSLRIQSNIVYSISITFLFFIKLLLPRARR